MNEKKPANPWTKSLLIWVGVLFGLVLFVQMIDGPGAAASQAIPYSEFVRQVDEGSVKSVTTAANNTGNQVITGKLASGESFRTLAPARGPSIIWTNRTSPNSTPTQMSRLLVQGLPGFLSLSSI